MAGNEREPQNAVFEEGYNEINGYFNQLASDPNNPNIRFKELNHGALFIEKPPEDPDRFFVRTDDYWFSISEQEGAEKLGLPNLVFQMLDNYELELDTIDIATFSTSARKSITERLVSMACISIEQSYLPNVSDFAPKFEGQSRY